MIADLIALARFKTQVWWLILTGHGHDPAPDSLLRAYDRHIEAWATRQARKPS